MDALIPTFSLSDLESSKFLVKTNPARIEFEEALINYGCVAIAVCTNKRDILEKAHCTAIEFFRMPMSIKTEMHLPSRGKGYKPLGSERLAASLNKPGLADLRESYNVSSTPDADLWPTDPPAFRKSLIDAQEMMRGIYLRLCVIISRLLNVDADIFQSSDPAAQSILRVNYCSGAHRLGSFRADRVSEHTDFGTLSLIWSMCGCSDLQISSRTGSWVDATVGTQDIVVVIGDLLHRWTNGRWPAALHRVSGAVDRERVSLVYLGGPSLDTIISPIANEDAPLFQPIRAKDYIQEKSKKCRLEP